MDRLFGLEATSEDMKVFHAVHIYAIFSATNFVRYQSGNPAGIEAVDKMLWHGHVQATLVHKGLRKRYTSRFGDVQALSGAPF